MTILAIDPGPTHSAYAEIDEVDRRPLDVGKVPNDQLLNRIRFPVQIENLAGESVLLHAPDRVVIEMISSYGMPVGREVFDTCVWIGRFVQAYGIGEAELVLRDDVRLHHCRTKKAKDPNVTHALVDRFAPGARNRGKGTKADPGWFHGFHSDVWQAYALAVYVADTAPREDATP